jgi:hypothetical protein
MNGTFSTGGLVLTELAVFKSLVGILKKTLAFSA